MKMQEKSLEFWIRDAACGSGGLLVKPGTAMEKKVRGLSSPRKGKEGGWKTPSPLKLFEYIPETWAMANMNMIIHDIEGQIENGDSFKNPKLRDKGSKLHTFDRIVASPMRNQEWLTEADERKEEEKLSRIGDHAELKKNDYNISPSRCIRTSDAETYRPIAETVEELKVIESGARETDRVLQQILKKPGV